MLRLPSDAFFVLKKRNTIEYQNMQYFSVSIKQSLFSNVTGYTIHTRARAHMHTRARAHICYPSTHSRSLPRLEGDGDVASKRSQHSVHAKATLPREDHLLHITLLLHPMHCQPFDRWRSIVLPAPPSNVTHSTPCQERGTFNDTMTSYGLKKTCP